MDINQYNALEKGVPKITSIKANELADQSDRTLIYGYTVGRETFHLYLENGTFNRVIYDGDKVFLAGETELDVIELMQCVPDKRVYPERCDFEFCRILKSRDVSIPFTTFNPNVEARAFYGEKSEVLDRTPPVLLRFTGDLINLDEIGLKHRSFELHCDIQELFRGQLTGFLRSAVLDKQPKIAWINNIRTSIEAVINRGEGDYKMSDEAFNALFCQAMKLAEDRIEEIEAYRAQLGAPPPRKPGKP